MPLSAVKHTGKGNWQIEERFLEEILPVVEMWLFKFPNRKIYTRWYLMQEPEGRHQKFQLNKATESRKAKIKICEESFSNDSCNYIFYYWCQYICCGRSEYPLQTHSLFSVDWPVWETLEYNLLVLTCSLKKALSTGIRLSWQGQLRLALTVSVYVSLSPCFLSFTVFLPTFVRPVTKWTLSFISASLRSCCQSKRKHYRLTEIKYIQDAMVQCPLNLEARENCLYPHCIWLKWD